MKYTKLRSGSVSISVVLFVIAGCLRFANGQSANSLSPSDQTISVSARDELLNKLDRLVQQNEQLEKQNQELMSVISSMRRVLAEQSHAPPTDITGPEVNAAIAKETRPDESRLSPDQIASTTAPVVAPLKSASDPQAAGQTTNVVAGQETSKTKWGNYTPNFGYKLANT